MGVSMTPGVWSQQQMDEAVDGVREFAGCSGPQGSTLLGASECRWRTVSYKEKTCSRWIEAPLTFDVCLGLEYTPRDFKVLVPSAKNRGNPSAFRRLEKAPC